jgi:TM2 domain-containing membrane protein YozV
MGRCRNRTVEKSTHLPTPNTPTARHVLCALLLVFFQVRTASADAHFSAAPLQQIRFAKNPLDDLLETVFSDRKRKDPAISVLLAAAPPLLAVQGLGQLYNGEIGKGLFFFGIGQVSIGTWSTAVDQRTARIARAVYMASWVWSTLDAYRSAKRINRQRGHGSIRYAPRFIQPHLDAAHQSTSSSP